MSGWDRVFGGKPGSKNPAVRGTGRRGRFGALRAGGTRQAGPGSGDAGVDGFRPGAGAFGTEGADADAEEEAGVITFHAVLHARPGFHGHGVPGAVIDEVFRGDGLDP